MNVFEKSSKLRFKNDKDPQYIKFGGARDNDASRNIRFGQLKLDGCVIQYTFAIPLMTFFCTRSDVAALFQPAIDAIVKGVLHQQEIATHKISVRNTLRFLSYLCRDFIEIIYTQSTSYSLVAFLPIPGFSTVCLEYSPKEILQ